MTAPLAVTSDGRLLINIEECPDSDLEGRAKFVGVVLEKEDLGFVMSAIENAALDMASHLGGKMRKRGGKQ